MHCTLRRLERDTFLVLLFHGETCLTFWPRWRRGSTSVRPSGILLVRSRLKYLTDCRMSYCGTLCNQMNRWQVWWPLTFHRITQLLLWNKDDKKLYPLIIGMSVLWPRVQCRLTHFWHKVGKFPGVFVGLFEINFISCDRPSSSHPTARTSFMWRHLKKIKPINRETRKKRSLWIHNWHVAVARELFHFHQAASLLLTCLPAYLSNPLVCLNPSHLEEPVCSSLVWACQQAQETPPCLSLPYFFSPRCTSTSRRLPKRWFDLWACRATWPGTTGYFHYCWDPL